MSHHMKVVVGGRAYADIDVVACAAAYQQLLALCGYEAHALLTAPWNLTIPSSVRAWPIKIQREYSDIYKEAEYVLVDVSDPKHLDNFVSLEKVIEVFDHHYGFEEYWKNKIHEHAHIEPIGACATLIWEEFKKRGLQEKISSVNANLLFTAIVANTLHFRSHVTAERDRIAAEELCAHAHLPADWIELYYREVEKGFSKDLIGHLMADTKTIHFLGQKIFFGQIEVWNAVSLLKKDLSSLPALLPNNKEPWIVNCVSIEEGRCYLFSNSEELRSLLLSITSGEVIGGLIHTPRLWLRKEFLKKLMHIQEKSEYVY